jgi:hypothetical protein
MKRNAIQKDRNKRARAIQRKLALIQGFYDGRFKPRVVKDKNEGGEQEEGEEQGENGGGVGNGLIFTF